MAVTSVGERRQVRTGEERDDGTRHYKRVFCVITDKVSDGAKTVLADSRLPQLFDQYELPSGEIDPAAIVVSKAPTQIGPNQWDVEIDYETPKGEKGDGKQDPEKSGSDKLPPNPDDWYTKITWSFEERQLIVAGGIKTGYELGVGIVEHGVGVVSSAGEQFDPPATKDDACPILTFECYRTRFSVDEALQYINSVNSDVFWGGQPRQWRITGYSTPGKAVRQVDQAKIVYFPVNIEMKFRKETWDLQILDQGTYYLDAVDATKRHPFVTEDGQPRTGLLDGAGKPKAAGVDPVFRRFKVYTERPFGALKLPASFAAK